MSTAVGEGGGWDRKCPQCGREMRKLDDRTHVCDHCGMAIGAGGGGGGGRAGVTVRGQGGGGGGGWAGLSGPLLVKPNPIFETWPTLKEGDRVGFEQGGYVYTGIIAHIETDEDNGEVRITLEDDPDESLDTLDPELDD